MKYKDILQYPDVYNKINSLPLVFSLAYKLNKINKKVTEELEFYNNKLKEIILKYAEMDSNGNVVFTDLQQTRVKIKDGMLSQCEHELSDLRETEIDLVPTLTLEELDNINEISANDVEALYCFIKDD